MKKYTEYTISEYNDLVSVWNNVYSDHCTCLQIDIEDTDKSFLSGLKQTFSSGKTIRSKLQTTKSRLEPFTHYQYQTVSDESTPYTVSELAKLISRKANKILSKL